MPKTNEATRFKPKPPGEKYIRTQVHLRPDQVAWLANQGEKSAAIRDAVDMWMRAHAPDDADHGAALDAMAAEPAELDEATP